VDDIQKKVIGIISERLSKEPDKISVNSNVVADLGADSLDIAEIMMDLEDEFGIKLEDDNQDGPKTVGDIVRYITEKVTAKDA
jgi:acyl carrier protein